MYHIKYIPDCPKCGKEMIGSYKNLPPFDNEHPFGNGVEGRWSCNSCGYKSEPLDHKPYLDILEHSCTKEELFEYVKSKIETLG